MKLKMKMKWRFPIIVMMVILVVSMVPNTHLLTVISNDEVQTESPTASASSHRAALMLGGDETDLGFSYVAVEAINYLNATYGWDISISRHVAFADQYGVARGYAEAGYDVIFFVGGQFIETSYFAGLAEQYNNTFFVQVPGLNEFVPAPENLVGLHPSFQVEGHYLAGVLAGCMTETNRTGVVFGEWYEYLSMEFYAYKAGVESVNNDTIVYARVAGTWGDAAIGKQITKSLIDAKNVDIVVQVADLTGRGVIAAVVEANITVIGTVADQWILAPDNTMTSIGMNDTLLFDLVAKYIENGTAWSALGGTSWKLPIGDFLYPYHNYDARIPQSCKDKVDDARAGIANGSIIVPLTVTENAPVDPDAVDLAAAIPGFPLVYLALATTTMLGVMLLLVNKSRRIANKHKS